MSDFEDEILDPEVAYLLAHPSASDPADGYHSPFAQARARIDRTAARRAGRPRAQAT